MRGGVALVGAVVAAVLLSGCVFGGESEKDLAEYFPQAQTEQEQGTESQSAPNGAASAQQQAQSGVHTPREQLEDLSRAPANAQEAVQRFFHFLAEGRLQEAWSTTSTETREQIEAAAFERRYQDIWAEATIGGFSWAIAPTEDLNAPAYEVELRYQTTFFGEIVERVFVRTLRQPHWVVHWTPDLIFDGLGPSGYLIHAAVQEPPRGRILDRNGELLAGEAEIAIVGVYWDAISDEQAVIDFFVERLGMEESVVRQLVYQDLPSYQFIPVAELPSDTPAELIQEYDTLGGMGILVQRESRRWYPFGEVGSHVVGYLQEINAEELAARYADGYRAGDMIGRDGIERSFEQALAGRRGGSLVIIDGQGRPVREIVHRPPVAGSDLRLTLDVRVQRLAEAALGEQPGAVVALDPRNGHVMAMASYPRIDSNAIVDGFTQEEVDRYFGDERQPFINRAIEQLYAPASTFKAITLAAALEGGGYEITDRISCPAEWMEVGDQPLRNWKKENQGRITLSQALAESCNTVFFELGLHLDRIDADLLPSTAAGFGFGQPTGIVGLSEERGINPTPAWKAAQFNEGWYTGDTLNMSIGQGFLAVTVLQMANAYAALATNGVVHTPLIVQSIEPRDAPPQLIDRRSINLLPVSADTLEQLQAALRTTVSQPYGTGFNVFRNSVLRIAGKSGTTEDLVVDTEALAAIREETEAEADQEVQAEEEDGADDGMEVEEESEAAEEEEEREPMDPFTTSAWFSAWADLEDPRLVVTVVLDDGRSGSDDAGPIVRQILETALLNDWVR